MSANGQWFQLMRQLVTSLTACMHVLVPQEIMSQTSLGRYNHAPRMRVQKAENVNKALQFIKGSGVVLTNIGPEGEVRPVYEQRLIGALTHGFLFIRYHRWECQIDPGYDLDAHPALHDSRHQVRAELLMTLLLFT